MVSLLDRSSNCFTKSYGKLLKGSGSILQISEELGEESKHNEMEKFKGRLRYLSGKELLRIFCFPSEFKMPGTLTNRQQYGLIGNSLNVRVVGEVIKFCMSL